MTSLIAADESSIARAAEILKSGGLVAMPTETVYGLAGDATNAAAIARIFAAKGRPSFNPLIIHLADAAQVENHVLMDEKARMLASAFWPGPLSMILRRAPQSAVCELAGAGLPTLAVRVPAHPVARRLVELSGVPLAAPSANISGTVSPTTPMAVAQSLGEKVDMILAAGACTIGLESTVIDLSSGRPVILRPGAVIAEDMEAVLSEAVAYELSPAAAPRSPGQLLRHYAPDIPLRLKAIDVEPGEALLAFGSTRFMAVRGVGPVTSLPDTMMRNLSDAGDLHEAAANLFTMLKALDRPGHKAIAVMDVPETGLGIAINDRLRRAASGGIMPG